MFEQHPVPQQISSYQFRLVGDMTLKQFFQVAGGAVIGLLLYASPLPGIFKWPLIAIAVIFGAAFAFLPLQERPLEQWMAAFVRAIYGPTIFVWQTSQKNVPYFAPEEGLQPGTMDASASSSADQHTANLEASEKNMLTKISNLFSLTPKKAGDVATVVSEVVATPVQLPTTPTQPVQTAQRPLAQQTMFAPSATILSENKTMINPAVMPVPTRPAVVTPQTGAITLEKKQGFTPVAPVTSDRANTLTNTTLSQTLTPGATPVGLAAQFSDQAAPPSVPTTPNIIVGQIMDSEGKIVEGAIMEIKDQLGRPVRALKTNRAGHFMIVTPLPSGEYKMFVEKDGLTFDTVNVVANGGIIEPIAVRAHAN